MMYLAEKAGRFFPQDVRGQGRSDPVADLADGQPGPKLGECGHFRRLGDKQGDQSYAVRRFTDEANRLYGVLNNRLYDRRYLAGDQYTIADMISYPWSVNWQSQGQDIEEFKYFKRWFEEVGSRPAVQKGMAVGGDLAGDRPSSPPRSRSAAQAALQPAGAPGARCLRAGAYFRAATFASGEVMSAKVTSSARCARRSPSACATPAPPAAPGPAPPGRSTRTPWQPIARAIARMIEVVELGGERPAAVQHPAERLVVEDDDDDRDVLLDRRSSARSSSSQSRRRRTPRRPAGRDAPAWRRAPPGCAKPIGPEPAACRKPPALLGLVEMRHQDAVLAGVAGDDRVVRQVAHQFADHPLRQDRLVVGADRPARRNSRAACAMRGDPLRRRPRAAARPAADRLAQLLQHRAPRRRSARARPGRSRRRCAARCRSG